MEGEKVDMTKQTIINKHAIRVETKRKIPTGKKRATGAKMFWRRIHTMQDRIVGICEDEIWELVKKDAVMFETLSSTWTRHEMAEIR